MKIEEIAKDLIYPSLEMQVLEQTKPTVENRPKETLEVLRPREVVCPKCGSMNCWKKEDREGGRKEYSCKDCKKFFIEYPFVDKEGREIKCPDCNSANYSLNGQFGDKQSYKCKDCKRKYILNPHGRDNLNYLNNINCRWCGSKNFTRFGLSKAGKKQCICKDCQKQFTVGAKRPHILIAPKDFEFDHDVWTTEHLGYEKGIHAHNKINFSYIQQPWLKYYFKKFILYLSSTRLAFSTFIVKVAYINVFSIFLTEISYSQEFKGINRALIINYLSYLKVNNYSHFHHTHCISIVKTFFETGVLNNWFEVEPALIRPEDWPKESKRLPRFIPEGVMTQLNQPQRVFT